MSTLVTTNLKNPSSGSNNVVLNVDGSVTVGTITGTSIRGGITSGTAQASTSGTSIDFTGIPSWVKRITVMFSGVSTNSTSGIQVQLGTASGFATSGYISVGGGITSVVATTSIASGFAISDNNVATYAHSGLLTFAVSANTWHHSGSLYSTSGKASVSAGAVTLSGALDRVRITTVNGTDTFDAGSINILYEG